MYFPYVRHTQCGTELSQQFEYMEDLCYSTIRLLQNEVFYRFIVMIVNKEDELPIHAGHYTSFTAYTRQLHGNTKTSLRFSRSCEPKAWQAATKQSLRITGQIATPFGLALTKVKVRARNDEGKRPGPQ